MRKLSLTCAGLLFGALLSVAQAQVNVVPQVGVNSANIRQTTYSAVSVGLAPASAATDIFCISGSTTKAIALRRLLISGTAGTLVTAPFTLVRRASRDTGGTAATGAALPVAGPHVSTNTAATAVLVAYTANPTIVDSAPLYFRSDTLTLPLTSAGTSSSRILWEAGTSVDAYSQGLDIPRGTATQQYCVNLNGITVASGLLNITVTWIEQ